MKNRFTGKTRLFLGISGAIIVIALIMQIAGVGLNLGIDFTGGSLLSYSVGENYDVADVETILNSAGYEGSQITKAAPSDASIALQEKLAAEAAEAAETEDAEAEATDAEVEAVETEETEDAFVPMLDMDKSGVKDDGLTDLQIRLNLVDESEGLEEAIAAAVAELYPNAEQLSYGALTNSTIVNKGLDGEYAGGYIAEFEVGEEFDSAAATASIKAALEENFSLIDAVALRYDAAAEAEAEAEESEATEAEAADAQEAEAVETEETDAEEAEVEESGTALRVLVNIDDQASQVRALLEREMTAKYANFRFVSVDHVSAIAGHDLLSNAVKALLIAFVCMLIYIAIRFDLFSGLAALFGLVHDVLIMCSFMVFFRAFFQVNSSFIAAVLTIVGYSINNTIIIFDRIRETSKKPGYSMKPRMEIVEVSVSNTLSRTINTSLTTLITLVTLYIFGVDSIREFAFPLIVGMLAGTYSSVLLSGQVWAMWMEKHNARKASKKA
ncbi:MAG: protein translocase subunit SecF [Eubacteriales bacterium]|nr:protein translocase subunit SecF [Eubacteriales bacterium]